MSKTVSLKITQASLNQTALDWPQNMANIFAAIDVAVSEGSDMVLMPELSLTGYEVGDDFRRSDNMRIYEALNDIAAYAKNKDPELLVSVGHPWRVQMRDVIPAGAMDPDLSKNVFFDRQNRPFNVQTQICGGEILGMTAKANLYDYERGYESRYFNEWNFADAEKLSKMANMEIQYGTFCILMHDGKEIPFGRPLLYVSDGAGHAYIHATIICEEKWVGSVYDDPENAEKHFEELNIIPSICRYLGSKEAVFLELADASPPSKLKQDQHEHLNALASNYAGVVIDTDGLGSSGATFAQFGHRLISQKGKTISSGARMSFGQISTTTSVVQIACAESALEKKAHRTLRRKFKNPQGAEQVAVDWQTNKLATWDNPANPNRWIEERIRNQALWMFDYMRKTGSKGVAQAISGGKDSAFNAVMVRVMVEIAVAELGVEGFCAAMAHLPYLDKICAGEKAGGVKGAVEACMAEMLSGIYMGTDNSSQETFEAARDLIIGIGGKFKSRNIQDLVTACAFIFGTENSTTIPHERKVEILAALEKFVHASPHEYSPAQMQEWAAELQAKYPEILDFTSVALPGQSVAYENFQARIREVLIMALANVEAKMGLANPNLDEAYGAYATFGGDLHSGTVNPNAGIHKDDEEALLEYLEAHGLQGVMAPVSALAKANKNRPTAELQPKQGGKVTQFDDEAMEGTFPQKHLLSTLMHHTYIKSGQGARIKSGQGARLMNASEIYGAAKAHEAFAGYDEAEIFNRIAVFYHRWQMAQHKIHATPIAPTFGENVDKQTSLRTPNLSGGSWDELIILAIEILFSWAQADGLGWDKALKTQLCKRAWQDAAFVRSFRAQLWNPHKGEEGHAMKFSSFDLRGVYARVQNQGWM